MCDTQVFNHIYGAPEFPNVKGKNALVVGSNGISGYNMLQVLSKNPQRWNTIYSVSRANQDPKDNFPSNVKHISIDLLSGAEEIAKQLNQNNVKVDYIFFFAYIQPKGKPGQGIWSDHDEMTKVNTALLTNFLDGLDIAKIVPKRFMLQTGAKHYGVHLGAGRIPAFEDLEPRFNQGPPNFYYHQEDLLFEWTKKHNIGWNVVRPSDIIGFARRAYMNFALPFAIYAAVQKHMGEKLTWPADDFTYDKGFSVSTAVLNNLLEEWAVLSENASNQAFNTEDGVLFSYAVFWPMLANFYGMEYTTPLDDVKNPTIKYQEVNLGPSIVKGYGPDKVLKYKFTLTEWSKRPEVKKAYLELAEKQNLPKDYIDNEELFGFGDACLIGHDPFQLGMTKARKLGFHATADPYGTFLDTISDMNKLNVAPLP